MNFEIRNCTLPRNRDKVSVWFGNLLLAYEVTNDVAVELVAKLNADPKALMVAALEAMKEEASVNLSMWHNWNGDAGAQALVNATILLAEGKHETLKTILNRAATAAAA